MRFDRNNLAKLLRSPLWLLGWFASWLLPRSEALWVVGSGIGFGEGARPLSVRAREAGIRVVWLSNRPEGVHAARNAGFEAWPARSWRGWWLTARAGTAIVTHGLGDVSPFGLRGVRLVQLWHGVPLKHLHRDAGVTYSLPAFPGSRWAERLLKRASERAYTSITHFVAASVESARRLESAFGLRPEQLLVTGDPRDDVLLSHEPARAREEARATVSDLLGRPVRSRIVLFAPTWRDGEPDPVVPTEREWGAIQTVATSMGLTVLVRPHPLAIGAYRETMGSHPDIEMLDVSLVPDITPVLPAVDIMVTDYSSIAYDFALLGRPMLYLAPDLERYRASRGFYESIELFCGGLPARSWDELLRRLLQLEDAECARSSRAHSVMTAARVHDYRDGRNTERVFAALMGSRTA